MQHYIALIHKDKNSAFGVMFPDFPGCVAIANTMEQAIAKAREALAFHAEMMHHDGEPIPAARTLDKIRAAKEDWIDWKDAIAVAIPLLPPRDEAMRVNINIDRALLAAVDASAERNGQSRSAFIARVLEGSLGEV